MSKRFIDETSQYVETPAPFQCHGYFKLRLWLKPKEKRILTRLSQCYRAGAPVGMAGMGGAGKGATGSAAG